MQDVIGLPICQDRSNKSYRPLTGTGTAGHAVPSKRLIGSLMDLDDLLLYVVLFQCQPLAVFTYIWHEKTPVKQVKELFSSSPDMTTHTIKPVLHSSNSFDFTYIHFYLRMSAYFLFDNNLLFELTAERLTSNPSLNSYYMFSPLLLPWCEVMFDTLLMQTLISQPLLHFLISWMHKEGWERQSWTCSDSSHWGKYGLTENNLSKIKQK